MSNKVVLFLIGLTIGFASFAAAGSLASLVMAQVQDHMATNAQPAPASYAQLPTTDYIAR